MKLQSAIVSTLLSQSWSFSPPIQNSRPEMALFSTFDSDFKAPDTEIDKRRNLAIISHPDSGKTTMTEKVGANH